MLFWPRLDATICTARSPGAGQPLAKMLPRCRSGSCARCALEVEASGGVEAGGLRHGLATAADGRRCAGRF